MEAENSALEKKQKEKQSQSQAQTQRKSMMRTEKQIPVPTGAVEAMLSTVKIQTQTRSKGGD